MALIDVIPTPEGVVTVFRGDIDAEGIAQALSTLKSQRAATSECIDDLTNILRFAIEKTGRQFAQFGNTKVTLVPRESMLCGCHSDSILKCPRALEGKSVFPIMAPVARYVRLSEKSED